ncbi:helix-turn-helix domain-containing protein [Roseovarius indicus]|uniref:helix-turn-helix domain-containing protein n=1 Tax=Roseovarius indicus TaxID=540747 RepID=UPI0007D9F083|nr:XRE family transcriptional regulator [Roseovarius indicus]OAO07048.1 hypothetical protein A8B76_01715 [Roseovarius indicus]
MVHTGGPNKPENDFPTEVGQRLRRLRQHANLSLARLSELSGVAKGTISTLEAGGGNPTIMTLAALSGPLSTTPSALIDPESRLGYDALKRLSGPQMSMRFLRSTRSEGPPAPCVWEFYEVTIPSTSDPIASALHDGIEYLQLLEGRLTAGPAEAPTDLELGQTISFPGGEPHSYWCRGGAARALLTMQYSAQ